LAQEVLGPLNTELRGLKARIQFCISLRTFICRTARQQVKPSTHAGYVFILKTLKPHLGSYLLRNFRTVDTERSFHWQEYKARRFCYLACKSEVAVSRASQHLDDARSKLAEVQVVEKSEVAENKHLEDRQSDGENSAQPQEVITRAKSNLEVSTNLEQHRQAIESEAEQQLRTQDKLNKLETQLDELVGKMGNASEQSGPVPR
jgi:hypothetical protein